MRQDFPGYDGLDLVVLRRYIAGQCNAAERQRVEAWAAETADRRHYLASMRQLYERGPVEAREATIAMWSRIAARMEPPAPGSADAPAYVAPWEAPAVRVDVRRRAPRVIGGGFAPRRQWPFLLAAAAMLVVTVGSGILALRVSSREASSALAVGLRQIATARGQRAEFQLSDGSRVMLGVGSRLRFPSAFGTRSRDLYLEGTAYFDVVHDAARPFLVHTVNAIAEDIGTRFVVTAYPEDRSTRIVVSEGAVALAPAHGWPAARVVLTAGRLGQLASGDSVPSVRTVDPAPYGAWMRGELVLREMPLADVAVELGRWYDGEVRLSDPSLANVPLTASFTTESFREAINVVTTVAPVRAVWHGRTVLLSRR